MRFTNTIQYACPPPKLVFCRTLVMGNTNDVDNIAITIDTIALDAVLYISVVRNLVFFLCQYVILVIVIVTAVVVIAFRGHRQWLRETKRFSFGQNMDWKWILRILSDV